MKDTNSLVHSSWNCKYHLVFASKYRRMEIYGQIRKDIGVILRRLCEQKGIEIIEAELCPDHISGSLRKKCGWQTVQKGLNLEVPVQKPSRLRANH